MRELSILGSTGSIGASALDVVHADPDRWRVVAIAGGRRWEKLAEQIRALSPRLAVTAGVEEAEALRRSGVLETEEGKATRVLYGEEGLLAAAREAPLVLNGLVGALGLAPSLAAAAAGARLALANKESLVLGGGLLLETARAHGAEILPVDSEHSGLFQCFAGGRTEDARRITLTASGGPLLRHPDWRAATPQEVLAHPVWEMGPRITTDSATMVNKGLEIIEAHWLFSVPFDRIGVLVHPQAIVHALVEWRDGSIVAQLAEPDMRLPIQLALTWPRHTPSPAKRLDLDALGTLAFEPVEEDRFPCFALTVEAGRRGGLAPAVLNAADEEAVGLFLDGQIRLGDLPDLLRRVLDAHREGAADSLEAIREADRWARAETHRVAVGV